MSTRTITIERIEEIRRRLSDGRGVRAIARALNCSRNTVRAVRDGLRDSPDAPKACADPLWMLQLNWLAVIHDWGLGGLAPESDTRLSDLWQLEFCRTEIAQRRMKPLSIVQPNNRTPTLPSSEKPYTVGTHATGVQCRLSVRWLEAASQHFVVGRTMKSLLRSPAVEVRCCDVLSHVTGL